MRLEIRMPRLSEFSDEGAITKWRVSVGDFVQKGEAVADVEVDMTTTEIQAEAAGKIVEIWVHAGQSVPVQTVIAMQSVDDSAIRHHAADPVDATGADMSDPAEVPVKDKDAGSEAPESNPDPQADAGEEGSDDAVVRYGHILASPAAIQLAEQYNIKLETLTGTGACGRIEREDIEAAMQSGSQFITAQDVDELMNFDGDFSSDFNSVDSLQGEPADAENRDSAAAAAESDEPGKTAGATANPENPPARETENEETADPGEVAAATQRQEHNELNGAGEEDSDLYGYEAETAAVTSDVIPDISEHHTADPQQEPVMQGLHADAGLGAEDEAEMPEDNPDEEKQDADLPEEKTPDPYDGEPVSSEGTAEQDVVEQPDAAETPDDVPELSRQASAAAEDDETPGADISEETFDASSADVDRTEAETTRTETEIEIESDELRPEDDGAPDEDVPGISPGMNAAEEEPEVLQVSESDTIGAEEEPEAVGTGESAEAAEPDSRGNETATVEQAIERAGSGESVKVRRLMARKMEQSWQAAPHFFVTVAVDMTDVIRFRNDLGVTINDFILTAATRSLQEHPWVNSHFVVDRAIEQPDINISLAVETENGLYYPIVRNCGGKTVKDLGVAASEMVVKAHSGELTDEDMEDGSFTISNMGMLGVESFSAVIMPPQVAVLAVGTVKGEVIIDEHEEMTMAPMVRLTLSADHRALDGADAADFLGTVKSYLEAPITLVAPHED